MSIHLVGGGWAPENDIEQNATVYGPFLAEATLRAGAAGRTEPRIAVIVVRDGDGDHHAAQLVAALAAAGPLEGVITTLELDGTATLLAVADADGIVIGGGLTPNYLTAVAPIAGEIRRQVASGIPYLGYSAGAMIAAERAVLGGWQIGGVPVSPQSASEGLDDITIENGIGLLDVTVDVHAAQWGTLSRMVSATEAGLIRGGLAVDEGTVLIVGQGTLGVAGSGSVWTVSESEGGVLVSTFGS